MKRKRLRKPEVQVAFRQWVHTPAAPPPPPPLAPLSERMPEWVPPGTTSLSDDGNSLLTMTPTGTVIGWDTCGRCGVHVKACQCKTPRAPRSVTYIWYQDQAHQMGEPWSPEHRDYRREFPHHEPAQTPATDRVRKRPRRKAR